MDKTPALSKRLLAAIPDILMTIAGDGEILTYHIPSQAPPIWQDIAQKPHLPQLMEAMTSSEECKDVLTIWSQALEGSGTGITSFSTFVAASEYRYEIRFAPMEAHRELVAIIRDVTSSYKANRELAKSEKRYRTLVENMNEGVALTDIREEILFVNDRLADIFNVDKEGLIGTTSYSLFSDPKIQDIIKSKIPGRKGGSS
ncbi:MAG: PAS domain S-box protein, partial [Bacteroidota bacterium]